MLRDVDGRAAVFTAKGKALQDTNEQERDWRSQPDRGVGREHTDEGRRAAHDEERHQKGVLPPHQVADASEEQRAEGTDHESNGKRGEVRDERQRVVSCEDRKAAR